MSEKMLSNLIPELDWRKADYEKRGCEYFYRFKYNRKVIGFVYCYPNYVVESLEEAKEKNHIDDIKPSETVGKWLVELKIRTGEGINSFELLDDLGKKEGRCEPAIAVKDAFTSFTIPLLKNLDDEEKVRMKTLFGELRDRNMEV